MDDRINAQIRTFTRRRRGGFTIVETVIACSMICIFVVGAFLAMTQINRFASASRLRTLALANAQQRIDEILTTPWQITGPRPTVLVAGTATETNVPLNMDAFNSQTALQSAFTNISLPVNATRTTQITDVTARRLRAVVTVTYVYRSRTYRISLTTIRTTDNI